MQNSVYNFLICVQHVNRQILFFKASYGLRYFSSFYGNILQLWHTGSLYEIRLATSSRQKKKKTTLYFTVAGVKGSKMKPRQSVPLWENR